MGRLKAGTRLRSAVCATEVMVIAAPDGDVEACCGGVAMVAHDADSPSGGSPSPDAAGGTLLGKRYVNVAGDLELLCTRPGEGSLSAAGEALTIKGAKPLPSSD
jgi:hypothetical protein